MKAYDVVVVGCGGIGSSALFWLSERAGARVLGLERFSLGHHRGASQDHSRMIRKAYAQQHYTELISDAYDAWSHVEAASGLQLVIPTGALDFAVVGTPGAAHLDLCIEGMNSAGINFTEMDAADVCTRWPQFRLDPDTRSVYQADGGIVDAARANAIHVALARERGAEIREHVTVWALEPSDGGVEVVTSDGRIFARRVVVTAGAWTTHLLDQLGANWMLRVTQEQVTYLATPHVRRFRPGIFPVWSWFGERILYGFPVYGEVAVKIAQDLGGAEVTATSRTFAPDREKVRMLCDFISQRIPDALGPEMYTKTCLYTLTPDRDFVLGPLTETPDVMVAVGAGHAFKFAGLLGKILSELALEGGTSHPIEAFRTDRPALRQVCGM